MMILYYKSNTATAKLHVDNRSNPAQIDALLARRMARGETQPKRQDGGFKMKSGLLWFDNSPRPLVEKIEDAAVRYQHKFGVRPNRAFIHGHDIPGGNPEQLPVIDTLNGIEIESKMTIQPNYVWVGVDEAATIANALPAEQERSVEEVKPVAAKYAWDGDALCPDCGYETDAGHCVVCHPRDDIERETARQFKKENNYGEKSESTSEET